MFIAFFSERHGELEKGFLLHLAEASSPLSAVFSAIIIILICFLLLPHFSDFARRKNFHFNKHFQSAFNNPSLPFFCRWGFSKCARQNCPKNFRIPPPSRRCEGVTNVILTSFPPELSHPSSKRQKNKERRNKYFISFIVLRSAGREEETWMCFN